jgi:hypothetical protein
VLEQVLAALKLLLKLRTRLALSGAVTARVIKKPLPEHKERPAIQINLSTGSPAILVSRTGGFASQPYDWFALFGSLLLCVVLVLCYPEKLPCLRRVQRRLSQMTPCACFACMQTIMLRHLKILLGILLGEIKRTVNNFFKLLIIKNKIYGTKV